MPRLAFCLVVLALSGCAATRPAAVTFATDAEPVALAAWAGGVAVARANGVEVVARGVSAPLAGIAGRPLALAAAAEALYVGTTAGLFAVDAARAAARPVALPESAGAPVGAPPVVTAVAVGSDGRLWAGTRDGGAFVRSTGPVGTWTRALEVSPITAIVAAPDGSVWVGSHAGLFHGGRPGEAWLRYKEEGTANLSLPDNVVDALARGAGGAVWVGTPTATALVEAGEAHPREFSFLGRRGGVLLDAAPLGGGTLLATSVGLMWLPALAHEDEGGLREIFSDESVGARLLGDADAGTPLALRGDAPTRLLADGRTVWLASRRGLWTVAGVPDAPPADAADAP